MTSKVGIREYTMKCAPYGHAHAVTTTLDVAVSTASACHSGSGKGSHVLKAMGLEPALIRGAIRFSFGRSNSISQLPELLSCLEKGVERLRQLAGTE